MKGYASSALFLLACSSIAQAVPVQWTVGSGGNDHWYDRVDYGGLVPATSRTYQDAVTAAAATSFSGLQGHLAVFEDATYAAEFAFVNTNVYTNLVPSNRIYWVGAEKTTNFGTPGTDWTWLNGSVPSGATVSSWNIDFAEGPSPSAMAFFQFGSNQLWDYIDTNSSGFVDGYIIEFEPTPVPEPAYIGVVALAAAALFGGYRRFAGRRAPLTIGA